LDGALKVRFAKTFVAVNPQSRKPAPMPRAAKRTLKKKTDVKVTIDRNLKRLYDEAIANFEAAAAQGAKAWDVRYEAIGEILNHNPPLYQVVYRNIRVARFANADDIERFTPTRLSLAIAWLEAKAGAPLKGNTPIAFERVRFPFKVDGKTVSKSLEEITVAELNLALALLKGRERTSKKASPTARALLELIKKSGVKATATVSAKSVTLQVPLDGLSKLSGLLAKFVPPAS
jgi:hypothetical protein